MNKTELITIISKGENERVEFKNSFQKKVIISGNYSSKPRNKQIASIFKEANVIEKYGSGIKRVIEEFENYGLPKPKFRANSSDFYVTVFLEKVTEKVTENQKKIIEVILNNRYTTINELSEIIAISPKSIKENIKKLKNKNIIKRIGPDKGGYWEVVSKNK